MMKTYDWFQRMYYRATHTPPNYVKKRTAPRREVTCYAESKDGIRWTRPELGFVEFNGSKNNNIMRDGVGTHNFTPFKDTNPDCAPDARYKAFGRGRPLAKEPSPYEHGLYAFNAPNELSFYVRENARLDVPGQLRRYTLRLDGFVSLNASLEGGTALTKPVVFDGNHLQINFATSAGGSLRVEVQDKVGKPIPGFTLADCHLQYGDQLDRIVSWKSGTDVSQVAGKPVRLRFELKDADLYSFQFTTSVSPRDP